MGQRTLSSREWECSLEAALHLIVCLSLESTLDSAGLLCPGWKDYREFSWWKRLLLFSFFLFGIANLKAQLLAKIEKWKCRIIKALTLPLNYWPTVPQQALGVTKEPSNRKGAHTKNLWGSLLGVEPVSSSITPKAVGNSGAWRASQGSTEAHALCVCGHSTISSGHLLPVKNQSFGEWQFRVFESKLQYFFRSAES